MITTAAVDSLEFKAGAYQNDMVVLAGRVTYVGQTSMEVRVDTYIEDYQGKRELINRAYLVMVAVDENGTPVEVPGLQIESEEEQKEWLGAKRRLKLRREKMRESGIS